MEKIKVICDTDVMIDYLDHRQTRHLSAKQFLDNEIGLDFVTLSAITKMELIAGISNKDTLIKLNKNIKRFNILLINAEITSIALQLIESFKLSHNLAIPDSLIAATAIHTGFKLFTFNTKDFKFIPNLQLYQSIVQE
ncbi:MAG: type toxin-antitoxin system VapC family toxin [Mucilaginibacter sp.]|nr:type toxin-antitoxin system VapC family toxin [Mucilaginibacter sp.]